MQHRPKKGHYILYMSAFPTIIMTFIRNDMHLVVNLCHLFLLKLPTEVVEVGENANAVLIIVSI